MSDPIGGGSLVAIPYRGLEAGMEVNTAIIEHMVAHPQWFAAGGDEDEIRLSVVWMLTDPSWYKYEVWNGGRFAGMLLLSNVTPKVDATLHFTLLPAKVSGVTLFGSRKLVWNFLGYAFEAFQLQRVSAQIPDHTPALAQWFRQRLGFRYEGEVGAAARIQKWKGATILDEKGAPAWIAYSGSRRERAHWDGTKWADLTLLRLLRSEYNERALGDTPKVTPAETL